MLAYIVANYKTILSVILALDYALCLFVPATNGVGGILVSIGNFIHTTLGINPPAPPSPPASS